MTSASRRGLRTVSIAATAESAVRPMTVADLPQVMAIERECYEFPWTEGIFRDCISVGYYCCLLQRDGEITGYAVLAAAAGEAHVLNLCIRRAAQGQGQGRRLLEHLFDVARKARADWMLLEVRVSNEAALALYRRAGFSEIGIRRNYYPGRDAREDAIVLSCPVRPVSGT